MTSPSFSVDDISNVAQPGKTLFLTEYLAGTLNDPISKAIKREKEVLNKALYGARDQPKHRFSLLQNAKRKIFRQLEDGLEKQARGPSWLKEEAIAQIVMESIMALDCGGFKLICYCIMPNHMHYLVKLPLHDASPYDALERFKCLTSLKINKLLKRSGSTWQESFGCIAENEQTLKRCAQYILVHPEKAKLVSHWQAWPFTFVNEGYRDLANF